VREIERERESAKEREMGARAKAGTSDAYLLALVIHFTLNVDNILNSLTFKISEADGAGTEESMRGIVLKLDRTIETIRVFKVVLQVFLKLFGRSQLPNITDC